MHNAHCEITGVVAVCAIHSSVDEQTGLPECAAKERGGGFGLSADQVHEGSPISNPEFLVDVI